MKLVFFWNYLNHHQVFIADALFELLGEDFVFVATLIPNDKELKGGLDYSSRSYCLLAAELEDNHKKAIYLACHADVCVFGACSQEYAVERAKLKNCGLAFECGERWLKRGWLNVLSPVLREWWFNYMRYYRKQNFYKLCSSAFTAQDDIKLGCYSKRHFKWGYFTNAIDIHERSICKESKDIVKIMWCSRFIDWKHPELAIRCVKKLVDSGYNVFLDMYGDGPLRLDCEAWVKEQRLNETIIFHGNQPNDRIQQAMKDSDIFLFTSDRQEGWGVVANEAMSAGCCIVGSDEIGAIPFLVHHGQNGMKFRSNSLNDLYDKVKYLLDNPNQRIEMSIQGAKDLCILWSPRNAAKNLLQLICDIQYNKDFSSYEGPCGNA